ncbi:Dyp-type peroxidase domain-containing protein, partial [Streptomyces goshikiensis]|uniref:Dyp-type peroxidase domain-containing protein n=1 Tax=Streptomyces goshikiensis TaxID=1942 RepID=UPI0036B55E52
MTDPANESDRQQREPEGVAPRPSRRALLGWGGAGLALGAAAAGSTVAALRSGTDTAPAGMSGAAVAFHGAHQAGIASAVQDRLHFAAFDVKTKDREELVKLLKDWTRAAERMTAGLPVGEGAVGGLPEAPPDDTGEALGLKPNRLTLTIGFGPGLFAQGRFGLEDKRPEALVDLEQFPGDNLDPARSGGDLCVQACADDPQVAVHA